MRNLIWFSQPPQEARTSERHRFYRRGTWDTDGCVVTGTHGIRTQAGPILSFRVRVFLDEGRARVDTHSFTFGHRTCAQPPFSFWVPRDGHGGQSPDFPGELGRDNKYT